MLLVEPARVFPPDPGITYIHDDDDETLLRYRARHSL